MLHLVMLEMNKFKYPYIICLLFSIVYSVVALVQALSGYHYNHNIEIWTQSNEIFSVFFPLFSVIPTCWLMFFERRNHFIAYTITRIDKKRYLLVKWLVSSIGGAFIVFIVSFVGLIASLYFIPQIQPGRNDYALNNFAGHYFVYHPFLYGLLLSFWKAFLGFIVASFGFVISLFVNNIFIILTGPFIYSVVENFTLAILGVPYYRLVTSFDPNTLTPEAISVGRLLVGPSSLLIFISLILSYYILYKRESIYEL